MKDNVVAKLAAHADDLYADVLRAMQRESVRSLWDKVILSNPLHMFWDKMMDVGRTGCLLCRASRLFTMDWPSTTSPRCVTLTR